MSFQVLVNHNNAKYYISFDDNHYYQWSAWSGKEVSAL